MRIFGIILLLYVSLSLAGKEPDANSQNNIFEITGQITDISTGEGLTGVAVFIEGTKMKTYTDFEGNFVFSNISPGAYTIVTDFISYRKRTLRDVQTGKGPLHIKLQNDSIMISSKSNDVIKTT